MTDAVLYARPGKHERMDQARCLATAERLGHGIESVTHDLDAALGVVESGRAKVLLCVDPRALGDRLAEVRRRLVLADAVLEHCKPSERRRRESADRTTRAIGLMEEAIQVLQGVPQTEGNRSPGRPTRRPRARRQTSPERMRPPDTNR